MGKTLAPNDTQKAMTMILDTIEAEFMGPYLRRNLPTPDVVLLTDARDDPEVFKRLGESDQVKLNLALDLWTRSDHARIIDMVRFLNDADLVVALKAIALTRGLELDWFPGDQAESDLLAELEEQEPEEAEEVDLLLADEADLDG